MNGIQYYHCIDAVVALSVNKSLLLPVIVWLLATNVGAVNTSDTVWLVVVPTYVV